MNRTTMVIASLLILSACSAGGSPLPSPTASSASAAATARPAGGSPTAIPSAIRGPVESPKPGVVPVRGGLAVGRIAEIVTTDLVVRSLPEISAASVIDRTTVPTGFLAYIVDGPVTADGYDWYQVAPFPPTMLDVVEEHPRFGWLAAGGKDGEPWIAPWDGECPEPGWDGMLLSQRYVMLSCWGGTGLTLEGTLRACGTAGGPDGEPAWLFRVPCHLVGPDYGELLAAGLPLHFAPGVSVTVSDGERVRVVGHLDDPAADSCAQEPFPGTEPTHPELVRLRCRLNFVVTEMTQLPS